MSVSLFKKLWNDECGSVVTAELLIVGTVLVLGVMTGLNAVRVAVVTELADFGQAIANLNQSYIFSGAVGCHTATGGSEFRDTSDTCDNDTRPGVSSRGLRFTNNGNHVSEAHNSGSVRFVDQHGTPVAYNGLGYAGYGEVSHNHNHYIARNWNIVGSSN